ncbi:hypothetical protein B0H11DRAFT_2198653 [Mycena galericulata]|nr:hypothetical protein B0H11DRAFT_2198653 [Mycena galericulata]
MHVSLLSVFALFAIPLRVAACESVCQNGTINAVLADYRVGVECAVDAIVRDIERHGHAPSSESLPTQIMTAYNNCSVSTLYMNMFPGFFHGKCQDPTTGIDPPGCPNPDCATVCGTPGSMCHFYSKFRQIAFNSTASCIAQAVNETARIHQSKPERGPGHQIFRFHPFTITKKQIRMALTACCGGSKLHECDKEAKMKELILSYP